MSSALVKVFAGGFLGFILWIIYLANTGASNVFLSMSRAVPYGDKLGHFFLFGVLTLALNIAFRFRAVVICRVRLFLGAVLVLLFSGLEELSQGLVSARTLDLQDFVLDVAGIAVASGLTAYLARGKLGRSLSVDGAGGPSLESTKGSSFRPLGQPRRRRN